MREIDRCIRECERFIERVERSDNIRGARQIVDEVYGAMSCVPNIKRGMRKFQMSTDFSAPYSDADAAHDIRVLAGKLRAHRKAQRCTARGDGHHPRRREQLLRRYGDVVGHPIADHRVA